MELDSIRYAAWMTAKAYGNYDLEKALDMEDHAMDLTDGNEILWKAYNTAIQIYSKREYEMARNNFNRPYTYNRRAF